MDMLVDIYTTRKTENFRKIVERIANTTPRHLHKVQSATSEHITEINNFGHEHIMPMMDIPSFLHIGACAMHSRRQQFSYQAGGSQASGKQRLQLNPPVLLFKGQ